MTLLVRLGAWTSGGIAVVTVAVSLWSRVGDPLPTSSQPVRADAPVAITSPAPDVEELDLPNPVVQGPDLNRDRPSKQAPNLY